MPSMTTHHYHQHHRLTHHRHHQQHLVVMEQHKLLTRSCIRVPVHNVSDNNKQHRHVSMLLL